MNTPTSNVPKGLEIKKHAHVNVSPFPNIRLCEYGRQKRGSWEEGFDVSRYTQHPICDCFLDYLLAHPAEIPKEWEGKLVCFWGTIYSVIQKEPVKISGQAENKIFDREVQYVRFLHLSGGVWKSDILALDDEFGPTRLSAELAVRQTVWGFVKRIFMWTSDLR